MSENVLTIENATMQFGGVVAVDNLNLKVDKDQIVSLIGPNGAGKTTTLKMLSGLAKPTSGSFSIFGCSKSELASGGLFAKIGILIEEPGFYPDMSAYDNLRMKCILMGYNDAAYAHGLLDTVGLAGAARRKVKTFSMGMKQRLGIAMALVGNPEVLILDEPCAGLDPKGRDTILNLIKEYQSQMGNTVLFVSHSMEDVAKLCKKVIVMNKGKLAFCGSVNEVYSHGDELKKMGLNVPEITDIFLKLKASGIDCRTDIYTVEQGVEEYKRLLAGGAY